VRCRPDCNKAVGDEDELVAACQDVMRGMQDGNVSKEAVQETKIKVQKVGIVQDHTDAQSEATG